MFLKVFGLSWIVFRERSQFIILFLAFKIIYLLLAIILTFPIQCAGAKHTHLYIHMWKDIYFDIWWGTFIWLRGLLYIWFKRWNLLYLNTKHRGTICWNYSKYETYFHYNIRFSWQKAWFIDFVYSFMPPITYKYTCIWKSYSPSYYGT